MNTNNKRIATNTIFLYFRMFLNIGIQLYTVPIVLRLLGQSDYGLYNVIGGVTAMLAFIGSSLASGSQRFFAYAIGLDDKEGLKKVFDTTKTIYLILCIAFVVIFETVGLWFVNEKLTFPPDRLYAANWVYQLSILAFLFSIQSIPYNAMMIAHENMSVWAYVGIISNLAKLGGVIALVHIKNVDYLILYAVIMALVELSDWLFYQLYCKYKYTESRKYRWSLDRKLTKEMLAFSGYNMLGSLGTILQKQGVNVVMNLFFGTLLNAAHGIALQVQNVMEQLGHTISVAAKPQITKYYAQGKLDEMWSLVYRTSLMAYYLLMIVGVAAFIELPTFFELWLHEVPEYTIFIARCFIISILIEATANKLNGVFVAFNKVKLQQTICASITIMIVPVSYLVLKCFNTTAYAPYIIGVVFSVIHVFALILIGKKDIQLNLRVYLKEVIVREFIITIVVYLTTYWLINLFDPSMWRVVLTVSIVSIVSGGLILLIGFSAEDRTILLNMIKKRINKEKQGE